MIYLDNAATTFPKPTSVYEEMCRCIQKYCGNPGRSAHKLSQKSSEKIFECRALLAEMFNAEVENIVFTYNTTYALNIAIKALVKENSHVLISDIEHNSVLRPIHALNESLHCSYSIFSTNGNDEDILSDIFAKIRSNTSLLVCTHKSNIGCRQLPIDKIGKLCRSKGIKFIVDGAQSAGLYKIDVKNMCIDALCIPGHKSLYGPQGVGSVIFGDFESGRTLIEGGTGINSLELEMPDFLPERYEGGTLSTPSIVGLAEGIKWLNKLGIDKVRMHEEGLYSLLKDLLHLNENIKIYEMNPYAGNTLLFNINSLSSAYVASELNKRDIYVRSGFQCSPLAHKILNTGDGGAVRVSFSVFNTQKDVYSLYDALCEIIKA